MEVDLELYEVVWSFKNSEYSSVDIVLAMCSEDAGYQVSRLYGDSTVDFSDIEIEQCGTLVEDEV